MSQTEGPLVLGDKTKRGFLSEASPLGKTKGVRRRAPRELQGAQAIAFESWTKFELEVFEELAVVDSDNDLAAVLLG